MRAELLPHYERVLAFIRRQAADFARRHRGAAERLLLSPDQTGECKDPHVERLIEAFAFLTAGIHLRLEDDFADLANSLLEIVAPHLVAPIPSVSIVHLEPAPKLDSVVEVPAGAELHTRPVGGSICRFRTAYPVRIWPIEVTEATLEPASRLSVQESVATVLRLRLTSRGGALRTLLKIAAAAPKKDPDGNVVMRFYLDGGEQFRLYDLLFGPCKGVLIQDPEDGSTYRASIRAAGLEPSDLLWCQGPRSLDSYAFLQEYFACPKKFLFFDLILPASTWSVLSARADLLFLLDAEPSPDHGFSAANFRLSCTPVVNLFAHTADDIRFDQLRTEYEVEPCISDRDAYEVYSVQRVLAADGAGEFLPLYSQRHMASSAWGGMLGGAVLSDQTGPLGFYITERRAPTQPGRTRTEVYLSFVDLSLHTRPQANRRLSVKTLCTSGDWPKNAGADPGFVLTTGAAAAVAAIHTLEPPTLTRRPALGRGVAWKLISHLSLNYLSMGDHASDGRGEEAVAALREILLLHAAHTTPDPSEPMTQQILGLSKLQTRRTIACPSGMSGPCRGLEVTVTLATPNYRSTSASQLLFASVLERFLGRYVSINSFTKMVARDRQDRLIKEWPPRAGDRVLI